MSEETNHTHVTPHVHEIVSQAPLEESRCESSPKDASKSLHDKIKAGDRKAFWCKFAKLVTMLVMVFGYFLVELIVGFIGKSLSLVSDAFHMMSDSLSLVVGLTALLLTLRGKSTSYSYGWARAEILGGLINSVFLLSVVFFIYTEAIQRAFHVEPLEQPWLVLVVGIIGLLINVVGLVLFGHEHPGHDHDHSHGQEGHSHSHGHSHSSHDHAHSHGDEHEHAHQHRGHDETEVHVESEQGSSRLSLCCCKKSGGGKKKKRDMNLLGVLLHVFGDFLGSIAVLIAVGINLGFPPESRFALSEDETEAERICTKNCFVPYVDPICSAVLATIMLFTTLPLFFRSAKVLMQTVPNNIDLPKLSKDIRQLAGVGGLHDLHVWRLVSDRVICSMHVACGTDADFMAIAKEIQKVLHQHEIHSSTIQPEFDRRLVLQRHGPFGAGGIVFELEEDDNGDKFRPDRCALRCVDEACSPMACCPDTTYSISPAKSRKKGSRATRSESSPAESIEISVGDALPSARRVVKRRDAAPM